MLDQRVVIHCCTIICSDKYFMYRTVNGLSLSNGVQLVNLFNSNGFTSESSCRMGGRLGFSMKADGKVKSTLLPVNGSLFLVKKSRKNALHSSSSSGIKVQSDAVSLGTLSAETTPSGTNFPTDSDEYDLDHPTAGFSSIPEAIEDIRQGKVGSFTLALLGTCFTIYLYIGSNRNQLNER